MRQQSKRVWLILPCERLLLERQHVDPGMLADRRKQSVQIGAGCDGGELAVPWSYVESGMLATHELRDALAPAPV